MELRVLLCLLAALQILPQPVFPAAPLPVPTVSMDPQYPVYVPGERVTLRCSAPQGLAVSSYQFYNQQGERVFSESTGPFGGAWLVLTAAPGKAGKYSCEYWAERDGKNLYSARSQPVSVPMMDHPVAPSLSATADGLWYDSVTVVCSPRGSYISPTFQIFKNGKLVQLEYTPSSQGAQFQLHTSDPRSAGSYTCSYQIDVSGRKVESRLSSPLSIHLPEPPGAPTLSLHQQYTVYLRGETVSLTCLEPPGAHRAVGFQFSRDGGKTILPGSSNTLALHLAGLEDSGSYTCAYWIQPSQWGVRSRESQPVSISVMDYTPKPSVLLYPDYPAYVAGERVEIRCSAPPGTSPERFGFYQSGVLLGHQPGTVSTWQLDLQANGTRKATRSFFCIYEQQIQERRVPSYTSDPASIPVFPALAAPSLQLIPPHLHYVTGETVTAECVVPAGPYEPRDHWLQRDEEPGAEMLGARHILTVNSSARGSYRCGYSTELQGRHLQSPPSLPVPTGPCGCPWWLDVPGLRCCFSCCFSSACAGGGEKVVSWHQRSPCMSTDLLGPAQVSNLLPWAPPTMTDTHTPLERAMGSGIEGWRCWDTSPLSGDFPTAALWIPCCPAGMEPRWEGPATDPQPAGPAQRGSTPAEQGQERRGCRHQGDQPHLFHTDPPQHLRPAERR
ncbi:immunoglobulin superfamily member 1-like isoform X2 [Pelodiscus sinensis]|uniref:immunoglobulin superfamily member 1-like isoform X2 n=1 Tax=Pelodiscus sinensis TaxID=13735 RepID=UPI003F6B5C38